MARPIRETPVLKGEDAFNFEMRRLEVGKDMDLVELTPDFDITEFDCGDEQLNNFLFEDAKPSLALRVANTFILVDDGRVAAGVHPRFLS